MGRALRQAHVQSEHRNASVWRSADSKSEVVQTDREFTLSNSATNFTTDAGQHHERSATRTLGQEQIHRTRSNCRPEIGVWTGNHFVQHVSRISGRRFGNVLAAVGSVCGTVSVVRIESRCGRTSTDLDLLSPLVSDKTRASSMGGPLCRAIHGTEGWRESRNLVLHSTPPRKLS